MGSIVLGSVLGLLLGLVLLLICLGINNSVDWKYENIPIIIGIVLTIICTILGSILSCNADKHFYNSYIEEYTITKEVIENSLVDERLGGFERIELVKQAVEENKKLVGYQYDANQWYGFLLPDEILELEPIRFGESNG